MAAGSQGVARLNAMVEAGALELTTGDVIGLDTFVGSELAGSESDQLDAVNFVLEGITVNDLNGDGRGFLLRAVAQPLVLVSAEVDGVLPVGTIVGFRDPNESAGVVLGSPSELRYERGEGVVGFEVDYEIAYDVPVQSPVGMYRGELRLELSAL